MVFEFDNRTVGGTSTSVANIAILSSEEVMIFSNFQNITLFSKYHNTSGKYNKKLENIS